MMYVMWSSKVRLAKVGYSNSPLYRVKDVRRHREDNTIEVVAQWRFHDQMTALSEPQFEAAIQIALTKAGFAKNATPYFGEWFKVRWPMAVDLVEQCAVLLQPLYGAPFLQRAGLAP